MYRRYSEGEGRFGEHPRRSFQQDDPPQLHAVEPQQHASRSSWVLFTVAIREAGQMCHCVRKLDHRLVEPGTVVS